MKVDFWRGRRILLTGHTGFKGSWLSLWLQRMGANVSGYALRPPTSPSLFEVANVAQGMTSVVGDVRDLDHLCSVVKDLRPEIIFHMAAQPLVRHSYVDPVETYSTNVMGTVHLLEAVRRAGGVRVVINVTSDKCYENREWFWGYRENEALGGYDPYSNSKACSELVTAAYRSSFFNHADYGRHGVAIASVRAGNVIGGGDWAKDRLVPDVMSSFLSARPVVIRKPSAIRPWQHVLEPLRGYMMLAEYLWQSGPEFAEGWNFGPNDDDIKSVEWIVSYLTQKWGPGASWEHDNSVNPHEAHYLRLDCAKAKSRLGWQPVWKLTDSLDRILDWHRSFAAAEDMRAVSVQQIEDYQHAIQGSEPRVA